MSKYTVVMDIDKFLSVVTVMADDVWVIFYILIQSR